MWDFFDWFSNIVRLQLQYTHATMTSQWKNIVFKLVRKVRLVSSKPSSISLQKERKKTTQNHEHCIDQPRRKLTRSRSGFFSCCSPTFSHFLLPVTIKVLLLASNFLHLNTFAKCTNITPFWRTIIVYLIWGQKTSNS